MCKFLLRGLGDGSAYMMEKQKMNAIPNPFPITLFVLVKAPVIAIIKPISRVMIMPVIQRVFLRPQLSTK